MALGSLRSWLALRLRRAAGPEAVMQLGVRDVEQKRYNEAAGEFAEAERLFRQSRSATDPKVVSAMARQAWCLLALSEYDEAISLYRRAIKAKESRGDMKEPTLQKLRDYLRDAEERMEAAR
jgi:tetratricopeptide (TPR) repeat protein